MRRFATIGALFLLVTLLVPVAIGDQSLPLTYSICKGVGSTGVALDGTWGPNINNCQFRASNVRSSPPFQCISQTSMNNCVRRCVNCNVRISVAGSITMDNQCQNVTSQVWITYFYGGVALD